MTRKNEKMYVLSGGKTDGEKCGDCSNFCKLVEYHGHYWYKCQLYGLTSSEATDWRIHYPACAWFNQDREERNLVKVRLPEHKSQPQVDGQMELNLWGVSHDRNHAGENNRQNGNKGIGQGKHMRVLQDDPWL